MKRLLRIVHRLVRASRRRPSRSDGPAWQRQVGRLELSAIRYLLAQEAVREAELAAQDGRWAEARQALARAEAIDADLPRLEELRAWLHWQEGSVGQAVEGLERRPSARMRMKLMRLLLQGLAGQRAAAHLDLVAWSHRPDCPSTVLWLAGLMEWQAGRTEQARRMLERRACCCFDAPLGMALGLMELQAGRTEALRRLAGQLLLWFGTQPMVRRWLKALALEEPAGQAEPAIELVEQLAGELLRRPQVIDTLVAAQRCRPQAGRIELFRRALARVVGDLDDPMPAIVGLAELNELAGDSQMARLWALRGLKVQPYSVRLALLLDRLDGPGRSADAQVIDALRSVLRRHRHWPDVRRALLLRYDRAGLGQLARRKARHWLAVQPDQPLARRTAEELAA